MHKRNTHFEGVELRIKAEMCDSERDLDIMAILSGSISLSHSDFQSVSEYKCISYSGLAEGKRTNRRLEILQLQRQNYILFVSYPSCLPSA